MSTELKAEIFPEYQSIFLLDDQVLEGKKVMLLALQIGDGMIIFNPMQSSCGRFEVDPEQEYGMSEQAADLMLKVNRGIITKLVDLSNEMAETVQDALGVTEGDVAAHVYSGQTLSDLIFSASSLMATHALVEFQHNHSNDEIFSEGNHHQMS